MNDSRINVGRIERKRNPTSDLIAEGNMCIGLCRREAAVL
jgi:hypothetical protein